MKKNKIKRKKSIIIAIVLIIILLLIMLVIFFNRKNNILKIQTNKEKEQVNTEITYRKTKINDDATQASILVTVRSDNGIKKVTTPDNEEIMPVDGRKKLALDYEVNIGEDYTFKVEDNNGVETPKTITVEIGKIYTIEDLEEMNLYLSKDYELMNNLDFKDRESYRTQERYDYYNQDDDEDGNPDNSWDSLGKYGNTFDGGFHSISNLYISRWNENRQGLFSYVTGNIKNLMIEDIYLDAGASGQRRI